MDFAHPKVLTSLNISDMVRLENSSSLFGLLFGPVVDYYLQMGMNVVVLEV